jgi:hypothetical protein
MGALIVWLLFIASVAVTVMQHVQFATGARRRHFFGFLETSGWLTVALATGIAAFRLGPNALSIGAGIVGFLLVLVGSMLRPADRRAATASKSKPAVRG